RTSRQKGMLSLPDLENIERRCSSAYGELGFAHRFDHVIPNHDGEDSEHWDAFYHPLGDARRTLLALAALLQGRTPEGIERWGPTSSSNKPTPPGVLRMPRQLCWPRHGARPCHQTPHARSSHRPKTQSWVGILGSHHGGGALRHLVGWDVL